MNVTCPHCSTQLTATEEHIGLKVKCQKCQRGFVVERPKPATSSANEPGTSPKNPVQTQPAPQTEEIRIEPDARTAEPKFAISRNIGNSHRPGFEAKSWSTFFDFRFRSFLTPRLVKVIYGFAFFFVCVSIYVNSVELYQVIQLITKDDNSPDPTRNWAFNNVELSSWDKFKLLLGVLFQYIVIGVSLLVARLFCESVMVQYRKLEVLERIDKLD